MGQRTGRHKQAMKESRMSHFQTENYSQEKQKKLTKHVQILTGLMQTREEFNGIKQEFWIMMKTWKKVNNTCNIPSPHFQANISSPLGHKQSIRDCFRDNYKKLKIKSHC